MNLEIPHDFSVNLTIFIFLMLMAGLMSGLTLGLLSIDRLRLEVLLRDVNSSKRKYVVKLYPCLKHQHYLLITLLIANAGCVEAMPIFLDKISNPVMAIIISVIGVLVFGEVIPQAVCKTYGLTIGYYCYPLIYTIMVLLSPLAWPFSKLMDFILGNHVHLYNRSQLKLFLDLHALTMTPSGVVPSKRAGSGYGTASLAEDNGKRQDVNTTGVLSSKELILLKNILDVSSESISAYIKPLTECTIMSLQSQIDLELMKLLMTNGIMQVPIASSKCQIEAILQVDRALLALLDTDTSSRMQTIEQLHNGKPGLFLPAQFVDLHDNGADAVIAFISNPSIQFLCVTSHSNYSFKDISREVYGLVFRSQLFSRLSRADKFDVFHEF